MEPQWQTHGTTDIPLTEHGRLVAQRMRPVLVRNFSGRALCSPMQRARETCELAGLGEMVIDPDPAEWNDGEHEGKTPDEIHKLTPGWLIFREDCPGGETPEQVGARADRVIASTRAFDRNILLFSHGHVHVLRVLVARWIGLTRVAATIFSWIQVRCASSATTMMHRL